MNSRPCQQAERRRGVGAIGEIAETQETGPLVREVEVCFRIDLITVVFVVDSGQIVQIDPNAPWPGAFGSGQSGRARILFVGPEKRDRGIWLFGNAVRSRP